MHLTNAIYSDYRRHRACGARNALAVILFAQGFWATFVFRVCRSLTQSVHVPVLRQVCRLLCLILQKLAEIVTGISLPLDCAVGPGLYIGHMGPVIINSAVRIGANCNLSHLVTIGIGGRGAKRGCPVLGDRVYVGPGAIIFGNISIGDDVAVGAGAIVTKSIPSRAVVAGNPARILSCQGSFDFVRYDGMEADPARILAQQQPTPKPIPSSEEPTKHEACSDFL